jgi:hypothetical protein
VVTTEESNRELLFAGLQRPCVPIISADGLQPLGLSVPRFLTAGAPGRYPAFAQWEIALRSTVEPSPQAEASSNKQY